MARMARAGSTGSSRSADLTCQIANFVPRGSTAEGLFNPDDWMEPKEQRKVDDFIIYAVAAAEQAIKDSGFKRYSRKAGNDGRSDRLGYRRIVGHRRYVAPAEGEGAAARVAVLHSGPAHQSRAGGYVSIKHQLKGPITRSSRRARRARMPSATRRGSSRFGDADVMVAGGTESPICRIGMAGFIACRALSTGFNDTPTESSRPYDRIAMGS
jgi:3-oxoacyl-[acyl-carrier-protein] synthase II